MTCNECGEKPKKACGAFPKAVIEIDNPEKIVLLRKVMVPASMGDESTFPPTIGKYHNVLLEYEASGGIYLYSSDGIPTKLSSDVTELQAQLNALRVRIGEEEVARADADTALSDRITSLDDSLATVARTGSYNDLSDKPTIGNGTLTIKKNGSNVGTFTANATANTDVNIVVPTKTSDLANDGSDGASQYVESNDLATVATSGSYNDLTNKPTIGNATLTIKRNDTNAGTFTANATTNKSINIAVPTKTSDLTNDGADGTSTYVETRNLPTVGNATLTITENNTSVGTFTANATSNKTINITSPTKTSDLTNDGADGTSTYVEADDLPTVDTTYISSSNNAIANSTVTNSLDRNVMTNLAVDSTPSTTTVNLNNTKTNLAYPSSSTTSSISLPVASSTQAGVMNSATFDAVTSNTNNINAILNGAVAISNLPASPTQAQLTTAWENETGLTSLINRASVYDVTNNKVWTYYTNDQTWHAASNTSQVTVNTFTNSSEGTIKGSTNDGQVFAENDGTGSVNGWDALTSAVSSNTSKLATIAQGAEVNVQANWTQTNTSADDYIKNKPANLVQDANYVHTDNNFTTALKDKLNGISAGAEVNVQSDWSQTNTSADDYIKNKPANLVQDANYVHTDNNFTTTLKNKLDGIESGAEANVQADWSQTDTSADDYIKNKPTIPTVNNATLTIQKNGTNVQTFTANSSTNKTANITVPTAVSELTNDAGYATTTQLNSGLATKQNTLTAGDNIQINGNTISATDTTYTAGNAIDITNGEISADIHPADFFTASDSISDCGSNLSLDNTIATKLKSIELKGDTFQQTAPSPDYPQPVNVVTGGQTINVRGVNMFNVNKPLENKYLDSSGGWATATYSYINQEYKVTGSSKLSFSFAKRNGLPVIRVGEFKADGTFIKRTLVSTASTLTLDALTNKIILSVDNLSPNYFDELQIELGSSPTSYQPYAIQSFTVDLGTTELCKIGDYQDYIYKSGDDWYVHKEMGKITLDGSETWTAAQMTNNWTYYTINAGMATVTSSQVPKIVSNYFSVATTDGQWTSVAGSKSVTLNNTASPNTQIRFTVGDSTNKLADFKTWLSTHSTTVYYALATPTNILIEDSILIAQLDALAEAKSYNDQTNIVVTAAGENLPAALCVGAYRKSLSGVIEAIDSACTCRKNLVVYLPNGMTTYTNNDAPIPIPEVMEALERGQSVFLVDGGLSESIYVVTAANMDDGIYSMRADQTGINPRGSDGHWHISGGGDVWDSVTFINDATPSKYSPNIYNKTWDTFTSSTPLLDQNRRTYYPASSDVTFNNNHENLSVAELWEKLASSAWDGNPVVLEVPLQGISTRTTNLVDNGYSAENPLITITVSLGPDNYFERETSEHTITGWAAQCTPITFDGKEAYAVGIVRVVEGGNTAYAFVVSLTEVANSPIN